MRLLCLGPPCSLISGVLALLLISVQCPTQGWSQQVPTEGDVFLLPINSSSRSLVNFQEGLGNEELGESRSLPGSPTTPNPWESSRDTLALSPWQQHGSAPCNITVQRLMVTSLLVRWGRQMGFQCDLLLFSTTNHGRAFFAAAYNRMVSPVVIEHLGMSGAQQDFRLCLGCGWARGRRSGGHLRHQQTPSFSFLSPPASAAPHRPAQGESLNFCCLDFSLEELRGEPGWRMNRKPIESTLVACFMTLVIIVWSVAALIWPVPIIAGFLPNGMEQRRTSSK
ncbi:hypothetical protein GDO86_011575 [Hymenochirus boettgeri]|uniref:Transmembrane protein 158 n=1 Tax=Hymenochirus boettgeri TaxID=247094 RepID=A0A8T2JGX2_9PIPI|nr:hypothetical protein GDO86_011575 [Hymenochirus boettgeri]